MTVTPSLAAPSNPLSARQRYGLTQVATYGNLGAVGTTTARSLVNRRLVALADRHRPRWYAQLTPTGWFALTVTQRESVLAVAHDAALAVER